MCPLPPVQKLLQPREVILNMVRVIAPSDTNSREWLTVRCVNAVCEAPVDPESVCDDIRTLSHVPLHLGNDGFLTTVLDPD